MCVSVSGGGGGVSVNIVAEPVTTLDIDHKRQKHPAGTVGVALQTRLPAESLSYWLELLFHFSPVCQHNVSSTECIQNERRQRDNNCSSLIDATQW